MAEGLLRDIALESGMELEIDSAGTGNWHVGEAPDPRAQANMKENGHDISHLRARQFVPSDFERYDRIFVMDKSNLRNVLSLARTEEEKQKVELFLNLSNPGTNLEVPDPYFGGDEGFHNVYKLLKDAATKLVDDLNGE
jgi:protein-tyrosine phosphatase